MLSQIVKETLKKLGFESDENSTNVYYRLANDNAHDVVSFNPNDELFHLYTSQGTYESLSERNLLCRFAFLYGFH